MDHQKTSNFNNSNNKPTWMKLILWLTGIILDFLFDDEVPIVIWILESLDHIELLRISKSKIMIKKSTEIKLQLIMNQGIECQKDLTEPMMIWK